MISKAKLLKRLAEGPAFLRRIRIRRFYGETFPANQYGEPNVDSCPHRTSNALCETVGGDNNQMVIRAFQDLVPRKAGEGEFCAYATADGLTRAAELHLKSNGDATLNGSDYAGMVKIVELTAAINALIAELQAHTHGGAVPSQTFTVFNKSDYENTKVLHGSGEGI